MTIINIRWFIIATIAVVVDDKFGLSRTHLLDIVALLNWFSANRVNVLIICYDCSLPVINSKTIRAPRHLHSVPAEYIKYWSERIELGITLAEVLHDHNFDVLIGYGLGALLVMAYPKLLKRSILTVYIATYNELSAGLPEMITINILKRYMNYVNLLYDPKQRIPLESSKRLTNLEELVKTISRHIEKVERC